MSSTIQHKLLQLEIPVPEKCWEQIASDLNDTAFGFQFPARLKQLSIPAPHHCWDHISKELTTEPVLEEVSAKLLAAEVTPPSGVWASIQSQLDSKDLKPAGRRFSLLRYAAAAIILGILVFTGTKLFNSSTSKKEDTALVNPETKQADVSEKQPENSLPLTEETVVSSKEQDAKDEAALEASKNTYARLDVPTRKRTAIASQFHFSSYLRDEDISSHSNSGYEEALNATHNNATGRYIVLMTPDGHFIRMSKKLSSLICCVSGEEVDEQCKILVDKWRKQLAYSDAAHPGNFIDILSLVGSLQDNQ